MTWPDEFFQNASPLVQFVNEDSLGRTEEKAIGVSHSRELLPTFLFQKYIHGPSKWKIKIN